MQTVKRFIHLLLLPIAFVLICFNNSDAQPISVQTSVGFVHLPFSDWSRFFGGTSNSFYSKNNPNVYYCLSVHYALRSDHAIVLGTELIRSTASSSSSLATIDWKFQGLPITIGYEYTVLRFTEYFTPVLAAGISYFISDVVAHENFLNTTLKRHGNGYGIQASAGLNTQLTPELGMISRFRYRYSNGMAFTDTKGAIKVEFTGFDFSTGLSWTF